MPLARILTFWDLLLLIVGTVIGSGIFLVPAEILRNVKGNPAAALIVWILGGLLSFLGALSYAELSARVPESGGLYVYIREQFGPLLAFLYGWTLFFLISSGSIATLAVAFAQYFGEVVPLPLAAQKATAVSMILVVATVNIWGTRHGANLQNVTTAIKVFGILGLSAALLYAGHARVVAAPVYPFIGTGFLKGFGVATVSVLWAYEGWQYCTFSAGESLRPAVTFPRALVVGSLALVAIYVLANMAYISVLGVSGAVGSDSIASAAVRTAFGERSASAVSIAVLVSIFSAANGLTLTSPRVYYAMAQDGLFFKKLAAIHPRFHTPAAAVLASSLWAAILAISGTFQELLTFVVFSSWIFYGLGAAALLLYRKRRPQEKLSYEVPAYPWPPIIFIIAAAGVVTAAAWTQPTRALIGVLLIASGLPAFFLWKSRNRKSPELAERLAIQEPL